MLAWYMLSLCVFCMPSVLVICNTLFMKQKCKLVTYVAGSVKSTVDYIIVWQGDQAKVHSIKFIPNKECLPKQTVSNKHAVYTHTHTTVLRLCGICPGKPG